jgi:hypothetical protein
MMKLGLGMWTAARGAGGGSGGIARTARWGASTPASEGGYRPYNSAGAFVKLSTYDGLAAGSLGAYTPSINAAGQLIFDLLGAPDGAALTCTGTDAQTYTITIDEIAGVRHVGAFTEATSAAATGNYDIEVRDFYFEGHDRSRTLQDARTATLPTGVTRTTEGNGNVLLTIGATFTGTFEDWYFEDASLRTSATHSGGSLKNLYFKSTSALINPGNQSLIYVVAGSRLATIEKITYERPSTGYGGPGYLIQQVTTADSQVDTGVGSVDTIQDIYCPLMGADGLVLKGSVNGVQIARRMYIGVGGIMTTVGTVAWNSGTTYNTGDHVTYFTSSTGSYVSKSDGNLNNLPTNTTFWELRDPHSDAITVSGAYNQVQITASILDQLSRTLNGQPDIIHGAVNNALRVTRNSGDNVRHKGTLMDGVICLREPTLTSYSLQYSDGGELNFDGPNQVRNTRLTRKVGSSLPVADGADADDYLYGTAAGDSADQLTEWTNVRDRETGYTIADPPDLVPPLPVLVGYTTADHAGNAGAVAVSLTSLTGGIGTAPIEGDLVVAWLCLCDGSNRIPDITTSGYTKTAVLTGADIKGMFAIAGYKVMTSTPDTTVTVNQTTSSSAGSRVVLVQVWRNVDPTTPMDVAVVTASGTNTSLANPGSITPTTAGTKILVMGAAGFDDTVPGSISAGYLSDVVTVQRQQATFDAIALMGAVDWTSGAYDPAAFTVTPNTVDSGWAAVTMALRPAP